MSFVVLNLQCGQLFIQFSVFFHLGFESVLDDLCDQLFLRELVCIVSDKQQVEIFLRFQLSFPFVFDRLDTVKL